MDGISHETAAHREMIRMAERAGTLAAEMKIARVTLNSLAASTDPQWVKKQITEVVSRINRALVEADAEILS